MATILNPLSLASSHNLRKSSSLAKAILSGVVEHVCQAFSGQLVYIHGLSFPFFYFRFIFFILSYIFALSIIYRTFFYIFSLPCHYFRFIFY